MKKNKHGGDDYRSSILKNAMPHKNRLCIGIPLTGVVRAEWMLARYGQIIPTNWSQVEAIHWIDTFSPMGFLVADARNMIVRKAIMEDMEWLLFIDHDTIIPADAFVRLNDYMRDGKYPVVAGIYWTRSSPAEPLIYRGRGNSFFDKWRVGDKVMVDGIPMGCTLISVKLLKEMWKDAEEYQVGRDVTRRVFNTPNQIFIDPKTGAIHAMTGTEDLDWCERVMTGKYLEKAGFPKFQKMKYPFLMDTNLACYHIDISGTRYPQNVDLMAQRHANKHPKFIK
jgi:hypothetical protein